MELAPKLLFFYLIAINAVTFALFAWDKRQARNRRRRIRERSLLLCSLFGGASGGLIGMHVFRHKTRHRIFQWGLPLILFLQGSLLVYLSL